MYATKTTRYYVKEEAREVHVYIKTSKYTINCETCHIANRTIWIKLNKPGMDIFNNEQTRHHYIVQRPIKK